MPVAHAYAASGGSVARHVREFPVADRQGAQPQTGILAWPSAQVASASISHFATEGVEHLQPAPAVAEHDWLYEIAMALAEECDLRGIDA